MTKDQALQKLDTLKAKLDAQEAKVDGAILGAATWLIDKPWTARAVVLIAGVCMAFTAAKIWRAFL